MAIIKQSGELVRIESQTATPFFDSIGGEASYEHADRVAEWATTPLALPDDAPYLGTLHALMMATAQDCAEIGFYQRGKNYHSTPDTSFYVSLLQSKGASYRNVADLLHLGEDVWNRSTVIERNMDRYFIGKSLEGTIDHTVLPQDLELSLVGVAHAISGGFMQALRRSAGQGYAWGESGEEPHRLRDQTLLEATGYNQRLTGYRDRLSRTLDQAADLRAAEAELDEVFAELANA